VRSASAALLLPPRPLCGWKSPRHRYSHSMSSRRMLKRHRVAQRPAHSRRISTPCRLQGTRDQPSSYRTPAASWRKAGPSPPRRDQTPGKRVGGIEKVAGKRQLALTVWADDTRKGATDSLWTSLPRVHRSRPGVHRAGPAQRDHGNPSLDLARYLFNHSFFFCSVEMRRAIPCRTATA
jgi:hypothetical protein